MKTEEIANALRLRDTGNWYKLQLEAADALEAQAHELIETRIEADTMRQHHKNAEAVIDAQATEIARLREALRPLAATKARHVTVDAIGCAIIEATGDGPWSDHVCDLLTIHTEAAREALATPPDPEEW